MGHKLPYEIMVTPALLQRFEAEAGFNGSMEGYFAMLCDSSETLIQHCTGPAPDADCYMFAMDMVVALNRHLAHDGAWVVIWTDPKPARTMLDATREYDRWVFLWMDADGDVQFPMPNEEGIVAAMTAGPDCWLEQCEQAWHLWKASRDALDLQEGETIKLAQGEAHKVHTHQREIARNLKRQTNAAPATFQ
jgi:hypothetical protein